MKNIKTKYLVMILCGIFFIGVVITGIGFGVGCLYIDNHSKRMIEDRQTEMFDKINVDFYGNINFIESDNYGYSYDINELLKVKRIDITEGELNIDVEPNWLMYIGFFIKREPNELNIYYPKETNFKILDLSSLSGNIKGKDIKSNSLQINVSSGEINIDGFSGNSGEIKSTSGIIRLNNIKSNEMRVVQMSGKTDIYNSDINNELKIKISSGNVFLEKIKAGNINSRLSSGSIKGNDVKTEFYKGHTTSGDLEIDNLISNGLDFNTTSGKVALKGTLTGTNKFSYSSGGVTITNSISENKTSYKRSLTSGELFINGQKSENKERENAISIFEISGSSGDARLNFNN